jgi:hypothetical protein
MERTPVRRRELVGSVVAVVVGSVLLGAQSQRPMAPLPPEGRRVAPFFDGWYANPDGSKSFSFGYSNPNRDEVIEVPLGPDNFIEPKEFDGRQPTSFPPIIPEGQDGQPARSDRRERERGVFTVTVPASFKGDVVWTLRNQGQTFKVPGRASTGAYQLRWPMAMGSIPPLMRFDPKGESGRGPMGITAPPMQASVGTPLPITVHLHDDSQREKEDLPVKGRKPKAAINVSWFKHAGPAGPVEFSRTKEPLPEIQGTATTNVTFKQPGEYTIRVRADNFGHLDTSAGNQCCWTNGYVKVSVK